MKQSSFTFLTGLLSRKKCKTGKASIPHFSHVERQNNDVLCLPKQKNKNKLNVIDTSNGGKNYHRVESPETTYFFEIKTKIIIS